MQNNFTPETPTTERFLERILNRNSCGKHKADLGNPCWWIEDSFGFSKMAICNKRAKKAGFSSQINDKSLHLNRTLKK